MNRLSMLASVAISAGSLCVALPATGQEFRYLDLGSVANRKLLDNLGSGAENNSLSQLPAGEQTLGGVRFKVGPGLIQLGSQLMDSFPVRVEGIAVNRKLAKLHILHATCFGGGPNEEGGQGFVKDGTLIGQYIIHYADASPEGIPIIYGEDVRDWWYLDGEREPSRGKVVWKGDNEYATHLRLYVTTWENPKPDKTVTKIDYTSRKSETPAAPFCVSISTQEK
jgi:hypothetical protein